jgi:hypothetical protein
MAMIYVKAKPGVAYPYEGKMIPSDKFIPVSDIPYIRRGVDIWKDLEQQGGSDKTAAAPAPRPKPSAPVTSPETRREPSGQPAPGTGAPKPQV